MRQGTSQAPFGLAPQRVHLCCEEEPAPAGQQSATSRGASGFAVDATGAHSCLHEPAAADIGSLPRQERWANPQPYPAPTL